MCHRRAGNSADRRRVADEIDGQAGSGGGRQCKGSKRQPIVRWLREIDGLRAL